MTLDLTALIFNHPYLLIALSSAIALAMIWRARHHRLHVVSTLDRLGLDGASQAPRRDTPIVSLTNRRPR